MFRTGGLVGQNNATIVNAYSSATVTGKSATGGLVGENVSGAISQSYATGDVGVKDPDEVLLSSSGGLVGFNRAAITNSYATGDTNGNTGIGGLVGSNLGGVENSYATGNVSGRAIVGGLVGAAEKVSTLNNTYAAGTVTGTNSLTTAGLVGALAPSGGVGKDPVVSSSYWKIVTAGASGSSPAGTGKTGADLMKAETFSGWDISASGGKPTRWRIYEGSTMPLLRSFLTPVALGDTVSKEYMGKNVVQSNVVPVTGTGTYTPSSGADVGTYHAYSNQQGYDLSGGDLTIPPHAIVISAVTQDKVYDGKLTAGRLSAAGLFSGDSVDILGAVNFKDKNVGRLKDTTTSDVGLGGPQAGNYSFNSQVASKSATITPAELSIEVVPNNKVYDATVAAPLTLKYSPILNDDVKVTMPGIFIDKNAGTDKQVSVGLPVVQGADKDNYIYKTTLTSNKAVITRAPLDIEVTPNSKPYDGTDVASLTVKYKPLGSDKLIVTHAGTLDSKIVGNRTVSFGELALGGLDAENYTPQRILTGTTASIDQRPLNISATIADRAYDGTTNATPTFKDERIGGDVLAFVFADKDAGQQKSVSLSGVTLTGPDALNYTTNGSAATTASITPKSLSIVANADRKLFDGTAYEGGNGVTVSGFVAGETAAVLSGQLGYGGDAQGAVAPGNYGIRPRGLSSANYATTFVEGSLTVAFGDQQPAAAIASATSTTVVPPMIARAAPRLSSGTDLRLVDCGIRFPATLAVEGCGPRP